MASVENEAASSTQIVRESAKWVLASFAGVGAAMVAGVQLSDIGDVRQWWRLALAVLAIVAALAAVTTVILRAAKVITVRFLTIREVNLARTRASHRAWLEGRFPSQVDPLIRALEGEWRSFFPEATKSLAELARLQREVQDAIAALNRGDAAQWRGAAVLPAQKALVEADAEGLRRAGERVVEWANAWIARREFETLGPLIVRAGVVITTALVAFIWAVNPPREIVFAEVKAPAKVTVVFTKNALDHVGEDVPESCVSEGKLVTAIAVGGDLSRPEVVLSPSGSCPGALVRIDEDVGVVIPDVE